MKTSKYRYRVIAGTNTHGERKFFAEEKVTVFYVWSYWKRVTFSSGYNQYENALACMKYYAETANTVTYLNDNGEIVK